MQGDRVKVLVGSNQESFEVPYDLLEKYSLAFKKIRHSALTDSGDQIELPDVKKSTFEDFFMWLHAFVPCLTQNESINCDSENGVLDLAIFAQTYRICHLKNQTSDVIRAAFGKGRWKITPDVILTVYKAAPAGSVLRRLYFSGFTAATQSRAINFGPFPGLTGGGNDSTVWQAVFNDCPNLGWDYFQYNSAGEAYDRGITSGGACRFHDHSDVSGWVLENFPTCPYPHGAPLQRSEDEAGSGSVPVHRDADVDDAIDGLHQEKEHVARWSAEEPMEPEFGKYEPAKAPPEEQPSEFWEGETQEAETDEVKWVEEEPEQKHDDESATEPTEQPAGGWEGETKEEQSEEAKRTEGGPVQEYVKDGPAPVVEEKDVDEPAPEQVGVGNARVTMVEEAKWTEGGPVQQPVVEETKVVDEPVPLPEYVEEPQMTVVKEEKWAEGGPVQEHVEDVGVGEEKNGVDKPVPVQEDGSGERPGKNKKKKKKQKKKAADASTNDSVSVVSA